MGFLFFRTSSRDLCLQTLVGQTPEKPVDLCDLDAGVIPDTPSASGSSSAGSGSGEARKRALKSSRSFLCSASAIIRGRPGAVSHLCSGRQCCSFLNGKTFIKQPSFGIIRAHGVGFLDQCSMLGHAASLRRAAGMNQSAVVTVADRPNPTSAQIASMLKSALCSYRESLVWQTASLHFDPSFCPEMVCAWDEGMLTL